MCGFPSKSRHMKRAPHKYKLAELKNVICIVLQKKTKFKTVARVADGGDLLAPFTTPSPWERSRVGSVETMEVLDMER